MSRDRSHSGFPSLLQLSGLTSTLPDTVLSHLFSQVSGGSDCTWGVGRGYRRDSASLGGRLLQGRVIVPLPPSRAQEELVNNTELVQSYRQQISNVVNQANLQLFWNMYNRYGCPRAPWEGAAQAVPSSAPSACIWTSFLGAEGHRAMDSGHWVLVLGWVERMSVAPLIPHCSDRSEEVAGSPQEAGEVQ